MRQACRLLALLALAACAPAPERVAPPPARGALAVGAFSQASVGGELPAGWEPWLIDRRKAATGYALVNQDGQIVVHAQADASVSGLVRRMSIDPAAYPMLRWRWKVERLIPGGSELDATREDSPARIVVAFDGDHQRLDQAERDRLMLVRALSGNDMPYATLMYIWSNDQRPGTILVNPRTSRVRMLVVEQGERSLRRWVDYERDLIADFRRAFGEEAGPIIAIGVLTDSDDTRTAASAYYGDISLRPRR